MTHRVTSTFCEIWCLLAINMRCQWTVIREGLWVYEGRLMLSFWPISSSVALSGCHTPLPECMISGNNFVCLSLKLICARNTTGLPNFHILSTTTTALPPRTTTCTTATAATVTATYILLLLQAHSQGGGGGLGVWGFAHDPPPPYSEQPPPPPKLRISPQVSTRSLHISVKIAKAPSCGRGDIPLPPRSGTLRPQVVDLWNRRPPYRPDYYFKAIFQARFMNKAHNDTRFSGALMNSLTDNPLWSLWTGSVTQIHTIFSPF